MKIAYYRDENGGYHGVTDECPRGFQHIVYAGRGSKLGDPVDIRDIVEQAYPVDQLKKWELVEPTDVPDAWFDAIGYEKRPEPEVRFEIKDEPRSKEFAEIIRKLEAGYVLAKPGIEPEPEIEKVDLTILPGLTINQLVQDPLFWPAAIIIFVGISIVFKGCL